MNRHIIDGKTTRIVKLFPRLAPANAAFGRRGIEMQTLSPPVPMVATAKVQNDPALVRARLLRMILDSERSRRRGERPNAS
jgi:hypothetical protein